jgi:Crp-like helix-turn-helix protein
VLLLLANYGKGEVPEPLVAKISQEMLAEMIDTTGSRVSFFMNKFRKLGLIEYNGEIKFTVRCWRSCFTICSDWRKAVICRIIAR